MGALLTVTDATGAYTWLIRPTRRIRTDGPRSTGECRTAVDLLRGRLGGRSAAAFDVASAGVAAVVGSPMHPDSRAELAPWHLDGVLSADFRARQLRPELVERTHLVLGATTRHRSAVVESCPAALPIAFGLREFARLVAGVDPDELPRHPVARAHALVDASRLRRGLVPPDPAGDDVPDPIGGSREAHHRAAVLLTAAVTTVVDLVAPPPAGAG